MRRSLSLILAGIVTGLVAACGPGGYPPDGGTSSPSIAASSPSAGASSPEVPTVACTVLDTFAAPRSGTVTVTELPVVARPEDAVPSFAGWLAKNDTFEATAVVDCGGRVYFRVTARVRDKRQGGRLSTEPVSGAVLKAGQTTLG